MTDREKVIRGLKCLSLLSQDGTCAGCAYFRPFTDDPDSGWCNRDEATKDAVVLLMEQEPTKPIKKLGIVEPFKCGACEWVLGWETGFPLFCPKCGKKVDWNA